MHAAVQSGGRSPKGLNGPSASQQLKAVSDAAQNCGSSKGKKRDRGEQGIDPAKRDRDRLLKVDDNEPGYFKDENLKSEVAMITEKGRLAHAEAVEKLVHLMQLDQTERKIDFAGRAMLADIIAATESSDCLVRFVQLRGLPVLDDWLQEAHKGKCGEGSSPKETDKPIEELLLALLRALAKLPINLTALQSCSIGKSVNHLRSHKNLEIQKKAKCLVDNWKKRVDAEMKSIEVKPVVPGQAVSWPGKAGFPEISNAGNRRSGSSEPCLKNPVSHLSSPKALIAKPGTADAVVKSNSVISGSSKLQNIQPANVATNLNPSCKSAGGSELPTVKETKSSSSSQSLNNSQSCSSDHAKTIGSYCKEDARSSTAASGNASKTSGNSSCGHRRTKNARLGSGIQKEATVGRSGSLERSSLQETSSQAGMASEKGGDMLSDNGNGNRLIVCFPNPGRSPARSASAGSIEDPSVTGSGSSSPVLADKHEQNDRKVKMRTENSRPQLPSDANTESWHINELKGAGISEEGDKSACATLEDDHNKTFEEAGKDASAARVVCSSYMSENGVCSSDTRRNSFSPMSALIEIKYSEAGSLQAGDDTAMNLLASVAGEISKSELVSPSASPRNSSANEVGCEGDSSGKLKEEYDVVLSQSQGPSDDVEKVIMEKQEKNDAPMISKEEWHWRTNLSEQDNKSTCTGPSPQFGTDPKTAESSTMTRNREEEHMNKHSSLPGVDSQGEDLKVGPVCGKVEDSCIGSPDVVGTTLGSQCSLIVSNKKLELLPADEQSLYPSDKQAKVLLKSTDQEQLVGVVDHLEAINRCDDSTSGKLNLKSASSSMPVDLKKAAVLGIGSRVMKECEKEQQSSSTSAYVNKLVISAVCPLGVANGINHEIKESKDSSSESSSHVKSEGVMSQEADHSPRHNSKKPSCDAHAKEDIVSSDEGSSLVAKNKSSTTAKLDFDLNEGIPGDDGQQSEPTTSPVKCSSIHFTSLSPFLSPIAGGLPALITVAAPAKGPFVPPENLLRVKPETGWKGSAATSAFRPAEPRKLLEMPLSSPDIPVSDAGGKQSRPAFDIDLNVADDQILEEDVSQCSAQTNGSESGNTRNLDGPVRSVGIELDLNRADEVSENGQFMLNASHRAEVPLMSVRPLPGVFSNSDRNCSRDFDLNNGPSLDEAGADPAPRSLPARNSSSISFLPQAAGVRMNTAEMNNMSPWFASATPYPPVAIQPFLPPREQHYPIEATHGTQRIIASGADSGQFGSDSSRAPVIPTSPAMVFHPPYQYPGFPFAPGVHFQTPGFSIGPASYPNSAPSGVPYFPTITPPFIGPTGALPAQHARQHPINLPEGSNVGGHDSSRKWGRQGLDLNSGPASIDVEGKDERVPLPARQNLITAPRTFVEEQARIYQMPGVGIKRKEPEGSWDVERSPYKQLSWQ